MGKVGVGNGSLGGIKFWLSSLRLRKTNPKIRTDNITAIDIKDHSDNPRGFMMTPRPDFLAKKQKVRPFSLKRTFSAHS
ncbi:MAG: hypothetical protein GC154_02530 [bacterium]|nr:hypothetical protein [bacterium]